MFQFPRLPRLIHTRRARACPARVAPFGHPRIPGRQRLPGAFRRVTASFLGRHHLGIPRVLFLRSPTEFCLVPHQPDGYWTGARQPETSRLVPRQRPPEQIRSAACGRDCLGPTLRSTSRAFRGDPCGPPGNAHLAIGRKVLGKIAVIMLNHCVQCARTARRERLDFGPKAVPSTAAQPGGSRVAHCQGAAGMGERPKRDDPWTGGVEPRGFEPRTSAVQGRRSPG